MRDSEEWDMFDIRVMLWLIGHDVVNVVASFPPPETQSTEIVCDEHSNESIHLEIVCNTHMTSIMGGKHKLMPETAEEECRGRPPSHAEEGIGKTCKKCVPTAFNEVTRVVAVVKSLGLDTLVQLAIFSFDLFLTRGVQGGVFGSVEDDFLPSSRI